MSMKEVTDTFVSENGWVGDYAWCGCKVSKLKKNKELVSRIGVGRPRDTNYI